MQVPTTTVKLGTLSLLRFSMADEESVRCYYLFKVFIKRNKFCYCDGWRLYGTQKNPVEKREKTKFISYFFRHYFYTQIHPIE